ncbi:MAG: tyrosine-type recombinase/integrase [Candidatus Kapabacteria bacterium]|nr:tyrosine-type recombinase/integrase [Candidatus Kapabacteria bacterium]MDW8011526.1 tyrosine-type recombinase/integrase [Bacteroidota bacterium]
MVVAAREDFPAVRLRLTQVLDYVNGFLESATQQSEATRQTYARTLREFAYFFTRDRRFFFRPRDVERYRRYLTRIRRLRPASVATYMTALRRFCQYLVDSGVLERNPARRVPGAQRPQQHSRSFLTADEVRRLLESIETGTAEGLRDRALVLMMLGCACSERELSLANIGDIRRQGKRWVIYLQGKGRKAKDELIPIPPAVYSELRKYLEARGEVRAEDPLFISYSPRSYGQRMSVRGIREVVNQRLKEAAIKGERRLRLTPFSLRHTAGILLAESGASVEEIMERMRIRWRPTALLYFRQRGRVGSDPELQALVRLK